MLTPTRRARRVARALPYAATVLATATLAAACTTVDVGSGVPAAQVESHPPTGPVPAGLSRFYEQSLTWGDCRPYATDQNAQSVFGDDGLQCARLTVPRDYAHPDGATITLGVLRFKTAESTGRIGSLLVNPGGPGASGMELAAGMKKSWSGTDLAKRFDLVGFDPRGIGASQPAVRCLTSRQQDAVRASDADDDPSPNGIARYTQQQKDYAAACVRNTPGGADLLANLGTRDAARDMDILRSVLGDPKLTYLGYSYGTFLGSTYAEEFPANVRAMVLDGAVDPTENVVDETVGQGTGFQNAFNQFAQWCGKQDQCALGRDPNRATDAFRALVTPLLTHPVPAADDRRLSYDDATIGAIQALYSQQYWNLLNTGLNELRSGSGRTLMVLADVYDGRNPDGSYSNEQDAFNAVRCVDEPPVTDPAQQLQAQQRYKQVAPFLDTGRPAAAQPDTCVAWPVPPTTQPHTPNAAGLPRVLVVSTTNDPATPYQAGVNLAKALHAGLLTYEGTQHTAFLQGISCVDRWGSGYLINGTLPPDGTRCGH